jgi:arabinogalactan oligomer/maltooligosaccharide transport system permease protein
MFKFSKDPNAMKPRDQIIMQVIMLIIAFSVIFPILYIFGMSVNPDSRRPTQLVLFPPNPTLSSYAAVLDRPTANPVSFWQLVLNSTLLSGGVAGASLFISVFAAYAFSRFRFAGREFLMILVIALRLIPGVAILVPLFVLFNGLRINNTLYVAISVALAIITIALTLSWFINRYRDEEVGFGAILTLIIGLAVGVLMAYTAYSNFGKADAFNMRTSLLGVGVAMLSGSLPFAVWNLKGYLDTVPKELEEAARIDGASFNQTFFRVVLPLAAPVLAITFFLGFMGNWAEFYISWMFLTEPETYTLSMTLWNIVGQYAANIPWNRFAAYSMVMAFPVAMVYMLFQRQIVGGLTLGGVKG